jgi:hypothetical protein
VADFLIFIDTNKLLDFYRRQGADTDLSILKRIDNNLDRFICTSQVEMEFKKDRQGVIRDFYNQLKAPDELNKIHVPAFLGRSTEKNRLKELTKEAQAKVNGLRDGLSEILNDTGKDRVYATAEGLFRHASQWNFTVTHKDFREIQAAARNRFEQGYPPRKSKDTSYGDAINWEWLVHCAKQSKTNIVIVTSDEDYGVKFNNRPILNDWLHQEFRDRVGAKIDLRVTHLLSEALPLAGIKVSKDEKKAEDEFVEQQSVVIPIPSGVLAFGSSLVTGVGSASGTSFVYGVPETPPSSESD